MIFTVADESSMPIGGASKRNQMPFVLPANPLCFPANTRRLNVGALNPAMSCHWIYHANFRTIPRRASLTAKHDVPYMQRTREYYRAQGYAKDYQWAHHSSTPLHPLDKPLSGATVSVITTAMPDTEQGRAQRKVYASPCIPPPASMYTAELSWDKKTTHTNDVGSFLPLASLQEFVQEKLIGALDANFYSVPTEYSQRNTVENDAPQILALCQKAQTDIALLVPL